MSKVTTKGVKKFLPFHSIVKFGAGITEIDAYIDLKLLTSLQFISFLLLYICGQLDRFLLNIFPKFDSFSVWP